MTKNLTEGSPTKLILGFAIPLIFGNLFQQFYSMADAIIVGKTLGVTSLAAVGATGPINFLIIGLAIGICSGFSIPIAQRFGADDYINLRRYVANSVWLGIFIGGALTAITLFSTKGILIIMKTPENIFPEAYAYIFTMFAGIPVIIAYNLLSSIMRALGDSRTPVYFLIVCSILNIVLDLWFILQLHLGVMGASLATVISQGFSAVLCLIYMKKKFKILKFQKGEFKMRALHMKKLCFMGIPMGLQSSITAIGSVVLQTAVNTLGSGAVAAVTAGSKVSAIFFTILESFGITMATYCGQNLGAGKLSRIKQGIRKSLIISSAYSLVAFMIVLFFGTTIATLFVDSGETEILRMATEFLVGNSAFYWVLGVLFILRYSVQGMGYSGTAIFGGINEMLVRCFVAFVFIPVLGFGAVQFTNPAAWASAVVFFVPAYIIIMRRLTKRAKLSSSL
ncbi:MAG: MATE family efflux transporter [Oscillospiraceae bacterium]